MTSHHYLPQLLSATFTALCFAAPACAQDGTATLQIESIGLSAPIVSAPFVASLGTWDVAQIDAEVALLDYMPRFGEAGNAILVGHHLNVAGQPSAFYHLHELQLGASINIQQGAQTWGYIVVETRIVGIDDLSILQNYPNETLTLFTCHGSYDSQLGTYTQRFVVIAQRSS